MKNLFFGALAIGAICISCEKEISNSNDSQATDSFNNIEARSGSRVWHDNGVKPGVEGVDFGCWNTGGNCKADVIVVASHYAELEDVIDVVNLNDAQDIATVFDNNETLLDNYLDADIVDDVIAGNTTVTGRGDFSSTYYFIFKDGETLIDVTPTTK